MINDTICAISTPPGVGGIAVARISGHNAFEITAKIWRGADISSMKSHTAHLGTVTDSRGDDLDQAVLTLFRSPSSFTGEDVAEISVHGSKYVQRELLTSLIRHGARIADPGEFTRRAFASGKFDLAEAEAVADIIASDSRAAHRIAVNQMKGGYSRRLRQLRESLIDLASLLELELDFSEEDVEFASRTKLRDLAVEIENELCRLSNSFKAGNAIKRGIPVAIVGATNAGKSSLLNLLLGDDRAIVSDIHGTTRDTIEETVEIGDYLFRFIDTAGLRKTDNEIERIGIARSLDAISNSRIVIAVIDSTINPDNAILEKTRDVFNDTSSPGHLILLMNKSDLGKSNEVTIAIDHFVMQLDEIQKTHTHTVSMSAKNGDGLEKLHTALTSAADLDNCRAGDILVTNVRHAKSLSDAAGAIKNVIDAIDMNIPGDLIAQDLRQAISFLSEITGEVTSSEILSTIFGRFCIGK